jgi:hypothetical protein
MHYSHNSLCWLVFSMDLSALPIHSTYYSKLRRNGEFSVLVAPTSMCWTHISTYYSALTACYKRIVGATWHSQHLLIFCCFDGALLKSLCKMAASLKDKRTPITTPPYQVPIVDVTLDLPTFSLDTTFKAKYSVATPGTWDCCWFSGQ